MVFGEIAVVAACFNVVSDGLKEGTKKILPPVNVDCTVDVVLERIS